MKNFVEQLDELNVKMVVLRFDRNTIAVAKQYYIATHCPQLTFNTLTYEQLQELLRLDNYLRGALCAATKLHNNEQFKLLWELLIDCQQFYNQQ
jgi:hypothetical protein